MATAKPSFANPDGHPTHVLVSGSIAFDTIMVFEGHFKDHILPDQVHMLNVAFLTPRLKREFGGCAANIGYNLAALGGKPALLATIGHDGDGYLERLAGHGMDTAAVARIGDEFTAQAFITTDLADNQIIAFHPGAMSHAHQVSAADCASRLGGRAIGIVGPNGKEAMQQHAREMAANGIAFIFDPGQGLPMFDGAELRELIELATAVTVNDYEGKLLVDRTGWSEAQIASRLEALIVTQGGEGSTLYRPGAAALRIAPVKISSAADPTGCGDAYRGGLLFGLASGWDWEKSTKLGSVLGAIKIEQHGPQNHRLDRAQIGERFRQAYGSAPW
ncbi:MAG: carbohydrate kinase family protein [Burkholderiaceae bacterium]